jgi:hypothetical protein
MDDRSKLYWSPVTVCQPPFHRVDRTLTLGDYGDICRFIHRVRAEYDENVLNR